MCEHGPLCQKYINLLDSEIRKEKSPLVFQIKIIPEKLDNICCSFPLWLLIYGNEKIYWYNPNKTQLSYIENCIKNRTQDEITISILRDLRTNTMYFMYLHF